MNDAAAPMRRRGAPRKEIGADPRRFAAVIAVAAVRSRLVKTERQASVLAAVIVAPEGALASAPVRTVRGVWRHVAGTDAGRQMGNRQFNAGGATGRKSIKVDSEARAIRRTLARIKSAPGGTVWLEKCAGWLVICMTAQDTLTFAFAAFNLARLGWGRAQFDRLRSALAHV